MQYGSLVAFALGLFGCTIAMPPQHSMDFNSVANKAEQDTSQRADDQGIQGTVQRLTGDFMPRIGEPGIGTRSPQARIEPVQTTVWIFTGRIPSHGSPRWAVSEAQQHPALLQQLETDANGQFSVALPPGEYTVFAQYEDELYLNGFLGDGSYATVEIEPGQTIEVLLENTEAAVF
ncbi:carboxypeptidase-like regulatory domain-containing protein [Thermocoleostomius sinensis]|uniref:Carboxypeptidase-like regulatory domain-containing protein n=1 Tax=Thermocoleostomius sinensis A174 TaxID=2016057 RepID=A0A9E9C884_9CYAN|nr:carboxypeptidase-like regulatory domain-containing protein [Thermocoleostomius sinensis]WAL60048.1 carboxypeptidase-like regulatory domain-containing protein [Thermocoleostomius sinensis A174]